MGLFGKKASREAEEKAHSEAGSGARSVKVLGAGCRSCRRQYDNVGEAVRSLGIAADVEYITDMEKIAEYGVMSLPAVVVDGRVAASGRVLGVEEVKALLGRG